MAKLNKNKNNAEYFSHDADMRNDIKIKALRKKCGNNGYAVWCYLLETFTDSDDFEIEYNELNAELLASDFDVEIEDFKNIVDYCIKIDLLQLIDGKLFSKTLKGRFKELEESRMQKSEAGKKAINARWNNKNTNVSQKDTEEYDRNTDVIQTYTNKNRIEENREDIYTHTLKKFNKKFENVLPLVLEMTETRKQKIDERLSEVGVDDWFSLLDKVFEKVKASDFLCKKSKEGLQANFDWLFDSRDNLIRVLEGVYDNPPKEDKPAKAEKPKTAKMTKKELDNALKHPNEYWNERIRQRNELEQAQGQCS